MKTIVLYAARHGTTTLNQQNCFRGKINVPLDKDGIRDAHKLAFLFKPIEMSGVIASDKERSAHTARIICSEQDHTPVLTDALHPLDVGMFTGKPKDAQTREELDYYIKHPDESIPDGESLNEFRNRVRPALQEAMEIGNAKGSPILLVVHSSVIHEIGTAINGDNVSCLVKPGGVIAVCVENGEFHAEPIFKPKEETSNTADSIS
jgi:broad specificity phosphatase PhoE